MAETHRWNVYVGNPADFVSWPLADKVRFYEKAVEWHDYIAALKERGHVERAWGVQKVVGSAQSPVRTKTMMVAQFSATADEFSQLITEDPLWNYGVYYAPMLKSIEGDYEDDLERYHRVRARVQAKLGTTMPEAQLKFRDEIPAIKPGGKLEFLVTMTNDASYGGLSDEARLAIDERVLQFHDYHRQLREQKIIVDDGSCYPVWGFNMEKFLRPMDGYMIVRVNSYDEFSSVLLPNPLLVVVAHMTVALIPFDESRKRSRQELTSAKAHLV
jgi:hypothetical protein